MRNGWAIIAIAGDFCQISTHSEYQRTTEMMEEIHVKIRLQKAGHLLWGWAQATYKDILK
jgi:hypothetical protein